MQPVQNHTKMPQKHQVILQGYRIYFWHDFVQARLGLNINSPRQRRGMVNAPKEERRRRSILNPAGVLWIKVML